MEDKDLDGIRLPGSLWVWKEKLSCQQRRSHLSGTWSSAMSFALGVGMRRFRGTLSFQVSDLICSANIPTTKEATHRRKE